jgi:DNA-binding NarL/FixJ family response regulator
MREQQSRDKNGCTPNMVIVIKLVPLGWSKLRISGNLELGEDSVKGIVKELYDLFNVNSFPELTRVSIQLLYFVETRHW